MLFEMFVTAGILYVEHDYKIKELQDFRNRNCVGERNYKKINHHYPTLVARTPDYAFSIHRVRLPNGQSQHWRDNCLTH